MEKVLVITYYWPPSGGSGVQRWMYFSKYLPDFDIEPFVLTVDEKKASYKFLDPTFVTKVKNIKVFKTNTIEPLKFYSRILGGDTQKNIPLGFSGEENPNTFQKLSRYIRGNFFIPDARVGWNYFAYAKALQLIKKNDIKIIVTTGPPHSTHLVGLKLKKSLELKWIADFRDPWTEIYYNNLLYKNRYSVNRDRKLESEVLQEADLVLTIGPSMKEHLAERLTQNKSKVRYIYNGFDSESLKKIIPEKKKSRFIISHIGILSNSQPIDSFIDALVKAYIQKDTVTKFLKLQFIGRVSPAIINQVKTRIPKAEIEIIEYLPHYQTLQHMANADLLFNSLAEMENSKLLISGKLMEYIATGNPIICLGDPDGDAALILREIDNAKVFDRKNVEGIYSFINYIFTNWENNSNLIQKDYSKYSRYETTKQLSELIKNIS